MFSYVLSGLSPLCTQGYRYRSSVHLLIGCALHTGVGTQLLGGVKYSVSLNAQANFSNFTNSFILLFQMMTGKSRSASCLTTAFTRGHWKLKEVTLQGITLS